ncbi:phosphate ABC transporter permease subunit PstC [Cellulomonas sp. Root137]|uniref:phosphate ABC transporter permease subunit PstC n=1 Tax=Cellulomonas sp. Root137 TaxID=1736459 RepID=UPI0006F92EDB|nr:phosphate ABC transporter permease subunit PstC [Cellulomonas sp. Root137]KQY46027.1 phosphate ABC transporter permease [Cellulomonas sp. Root137]
MTSTQSPPTPTQSPTLAPAPVRRRRTRVVDRGASRLFRWTATAAGALILLVLVAVAAFLVLRAWPALATPAAELTEKVSWMGDATSLLDFVGPLIFGTILAAALALVIATPIALGIALFTSHYAPRRLASGLGYLVDLLAAIPSVVYGLWGGLVLAPMVKPIWAWLNEYLGFIPIFGGTVSPTARVLMTVGIVLAVMILPIITAVSREVFLQTPRLHEEAALALGATRWEMIRVAVLPFARSGIVSAAMLGLGRALGETMAVLMILSPGFLYSFHLLEAGQQQTIAANIAAQFPEANPLGVSALIATGLALFVITLIVNMAARAIVARRKDFSGAN